METLICSCGARSWVRVIAWIQMVLFSLGLLLAGGGLIVVLLAGKDAVDRVKLKNQGERKSNLATFSEYCKLVINFSLSLIIFSSGIVSAVLLIKGVNENKNYYLKWWLVHSVICLAWSILMEVLSEDAILETTLRISISLSLHGFSIFVVMTLLWDIEADEERKEDTALITELKKTGPKRPPNSNISRC